jgi:hypothetical protein
MKTCPQCGVENIQTAASCYRCAAPLEGPENLMGVRADVPLASGLPPTVIVSGHEPVHQHGPSSSYGGHVICPYCEVGNEPDWLFCQECGQKLPRPQAAAPDPPAQRAEPVPQQQQPPTPFSDSARPGQGGRGPVQQKSPELFETRSDHFERAESSTPRPYDREVEQSQPPELNPQPSPAADPTQKAGRPRMTTNVVCLSCGTIQSGSGFYCTSCGEKLSSRAMRRLKELDMPQVIPSLKLVTEGGETGASYPIDRKKVTIGRSRADITFPHDGFMSGVHARIVERDGRYFLVDENSRNGTFIRIDEQIELKPGDMIIVGKQVFRFEKR